jgi:hypothetical protein
MARSILNTGIRTKSCRPPAGSPSPRRTPSTRRRGNNQAARLSRLQRMIEPAHKTGNEAPLVLVMPVRLIERSYGSFARTLQLSAGVDPNKIKASVNKRVLKVVAEQPAAKETKKIEVMAAA